MKRRNRGPLYLNKETLSNLDLANVHGGTSVTAGTCGSRPIAQCSVFCTDNANCVSKMICSLLEVGCN